MNESFKPTFFIMLLLGLLSLASAQLSEIDSPEQIVLLLKVPDLGTTDVDAILTTKHVYLDIADVFRFLHVKMESNARGDSVWGFFVNEDNPYLIDYPHRTIILGEKRFVLDPSYFIRENKILYLPLFAWEKIFGLDAHFDFRSLSVELIPNIELPLMRELKRQKLRKNLKELKTPTADIYYTRNPHWLKGGFLDWSITNSLHNDRPADQTYQAAFGAQVLGGDLELYTFQRPQSPSVSAQQRYRWRYVDNDNPYLRQLYIGKLDVQSKTMIPRPMIGVHLTNSPSHYRSSFASVVLSDYTRPNWMVELYVNRVLVDFYKADAAGYYKFNVPISYGYTLVTLKFIGPWGEERSQERWIYIPHHFLPAGEWNYALTFARFSEWQDVAYSKYESNIGITNWFTLGGGYELSKLVPDKRAAFGRISARFKDKLIVSATKIENVLETVNTSLALKRHWTLAGELTKYQPGQKAIPTNNLEELKLSLFMPVDVGRFSSSARIKYQHSKQALYETDHWELNLSSHFNGINSHFSTFSYQTPGLQKLTVSRLEFFFRSWKQWLVRPFGGYNWQKKQPYLFGFSLERHFARNGYIQFQLEKNQRLNTITAQLGVRYEFPVSLAGVSASKFKEQMNITQFVRGSIGFDSKQNTFTSDPYSSVGRAAITLQPFLDVNANGFKEPFEPRVLGMDIELNGGRIEYCDSDSLIRIFGLEPYREYFVRVNTLGLENIAWKPKYTKLSVFTDPNIFKPVNLPVIVQAEIQGNLSIKKIDKTEGLGGIVVNCRQIRGHQRYSVTSDPFNGDVYCLGLTPGVFIVYPDPEQLAELGLQAEPRYRVFRVRPTIEGEIVDGLNFVLNPIPNHDEKAAENYEPGFQESIVGYGAYDSLFQDLYHRALSLFMQRQYDQAHTLWQQIIDEFPMHPLWVNCHYWIGECYHARKAYQHAIEKFKIVLDLNSYYKTDDALYMLGQCYYRLKKRKDSAAYFEQLMNTLPNSEYVPKARVFLMTLDKDFDL